MKTAEEFLDYISENGKYTFDWKEFGVLFAKYHVEQALKAASESTLEYDFTEEITNSYPLENIK
jgi:hypothetical protein